ncbi:MAG: hypothetical protein D6761_11160 [Candidatus Dadabacteria bacterium]|nr:MAG: hypothetical protein D6761_11160 [Candidatus Dadabacteria bacterium]
MKQYATVHRHIRWLSVLAAFFLLQSGGCNRPGQDASEAAQASGQSTAEIQKNARARYAKVGVAEIFVPPGDVPRGGWPVVVWLHGDGGAREDVRDFALISVQAGFAAVSVSAPIRDDANGGWLWPPQMGFKLTQQYLVAALAPFQEAADLNLGRVFAAGLREGGWYAMLLPAVFPDFYAGALALGPVPFTDKLPDAPAPKDRPLAILLSATDQRGSLVAAHFRRLWERSDVPFRSELIPPEQNSKETWILTTLELLDWLDEHGSFRDGKFRSAAPEYPGANLPRSSP